MKPKKSKAKREPVKPYVPTVRESATLNACLDKQKSSAPRLKVRETDGKFEIDPDHPDKPVGNVLLMEAIGAKDFEFLCGFLEQLSNAGTQGRTTDGRGLNFMLSVVKSIEPKDQMEAMLAAQMAAVHMATMTFARRLAHVDNIQQQDSAEKAFNKLARTFTSQMETLKRYRSEGQQKILVQHTTTVNADQAVVTDTVVTGKPAGNSVSSPALLTDATEKPMPTIDETMKLEPWGVRKRKEH